MQSESGAKLDMISSLAEPATISVGDVLDGKYEITGKLGEGAMGVVYEAMHRRLGRSVALKTLQASYAEDAELVARFEREARAASAIGHPNIVQVFDAGDVPLPYLVMEHLQGQSLGELLAEHEHLEIARAIELCQQCLLGLAAAHKAGIVHRDLKPDNIFIAAGEQSSENVKILDFGISKIVEGASVANAANDHATRVGFVMGTPLYMSPEQVTGRADVDHRTDLWSLACVLYECIAGTPPFGGENYNQIMAEVMRGQFTPLRESSPEVSVALSSLVDNALSLDQSKRFSSAQEFSNALSTLEDEVPADADFDDLANRFLAQEARDREAEQPAKPAKPQHAAKPADDRFGPPQASASVDLALDVDRPATMRGTRPAVAQTVSAIRRNSERVTQQEPSRVGAMLAKLLLLLLIVVAGAGAYRYYTLGYILPKAPPVMASLQLDVFPVGAQLTLGDEEQDTRHFELQGDASYEIALHAEGYLSMRTEVILKPGQEVQARTIMGHVMPALDAEMVVSPSGHGAQEPKRSAADRHAGYEKLASLVGCGTRLSKTLNSVLSEESPVPVSNMLMDECRLTIEVHASKQPSLEPLDSASAALVASADALNEALRRDKASAGANSGVRRDTGRAVRKSSVAAAATRDAWLLAMNQTQARWLAQDAAALQEREGTRMHVLLRNLAVASDAWMRAHLTGANEADVLHDALVVANKRATTHATEHSEQYQRSGANAFLRAMVPLMTTASGADALFWHNQAIGLFNSVVLPIDLSSK